MILSFVSWCRRESTGHIRRRHAEWKSLPGQCQGREKMQIFMTKQSSHKRKNNWGREGNWHLFPASYILWLQLPPKLFPFFSRQEEMSPHEMKALLVLEAAGQYQSLNGPASPLCWGWFQCSSGRHEARGGPEEGGKLLIWWAHRLGGLKFCISLPKTSDVLYT